MSSFSKALAGDLETFFNDIDKKGYNSYQEARASAENELYKISNQLNGLRIVPELTEKELKTKVALLEAELKEKSKEIAEKDALILELEDRLATQLRVK